MALQFSVKTCSAKGPAVDKMISFLFAMRSLQKFDLVENNTYSTSLEALRGFYFIFLFPK